MAAMDHSEAAASKGGKDDCGYLAYPAMDSGRRQVGRLRGGSCSNNNGGNVVALAAARLDGGLCKESMRVRAGDGGRQTAQQEGAVDDAGQAGGRRTTRREGGGGNARRAGVGLQDERMGAEDTTRGGSGGCATWLPLCSAWGGQHPAAAGCCIGGAMGHGCDPMLW